LPRGPSMKSPGLDQVRTELAIHWARDRRVIRQLWLFGSRARGDHRPDSDIDLAIVLAPGGSVLGLYTAKADEWQRDLAGRMGMPVSLEAIDDSNRPPDLVLLWKARE
jgi:predicted nucleotidyltransferase